MTQLAESSSRKMPRGQGLARGRGDREQGTCPGQIPRRRPSHFLREMRLIRGQKGLRPSRTVPRETDTSREAGFGEDQDGSATLVRQSDERVQADARKRTTGLEPWQRRLRRDRTAAEGDAQEDGKQGEWRCWHGGRQGRQYARERYNAPHWGRLRDRCDAARRRVQ